MVVLRIYGDKMVCAPFDRSNGEVERSFVILKVAEDPDLVLHIDKVGPLNPKETPASQLSSPISTPTPAAASSPTPLPTP